MAAASPDDRTLEYTPTWAIALVCTLFVVVSFFGERVLHVLGHWLSETKRKPLAEALEKMKEELMLLGFISLIITVTAPYVAKICISSSFYDKHPMPCNLDDRPKPKSDKEAFLIHRRLTEYFMEQTFSRRELAVVASNCGKGREPFITFLGLEQLHRFLFVMGCTHVFYTALTMLLAIVKIHGWRRWEEEARLHSDNQANMAELCRTLTMKRQSTFVAYHSSTPGSRNRIFVWVICFFRQFGQAVTKSDYLALRMGFVTKHSTGPKYDFHGYMLRSMEDDFKNVVGISPLFWLFVVFFMLFNIHGTNLYFWIAFLPVVLVLLVGAKLQRIIAQLALENSGLSGPLTGLQLRPRDSLFWFRKPRFMLHVIHFILFQDAFELATFVWVWWQFGWDSCFMSKKLFAYTRVISGFLVQILCSYSTFPLYALVTQMGSHYKKAIFQDNIVESLHHWKKAAKHRTKDSEHHRHQHTIVEEEEDLGEMDEYSNQQQPSAPTAEIEVENEQGRNSKHPFSQFLKSEKVANPFTSPNDTLLSPRLPQYPPPHQELSRYGTNRSV